MRPSTKKINLIMYKPGQGGNFLTRLFALSDSAQFLWKTGTCGCKPIDHSIGEKLKYYWYYPEQLRTWLVSAHRTPAGLDPVTNNQNEWENNPIIVTCMHYTHFKTYLEHSDCVPLSSGAEHKFFITKSSDELFNKMYKQLNMEPAQTPDIDVSMTEHILQYENYDFIDLDKIINPDTCYSEYCRVCELMDLEPIDKEIALSFVENWVKIRVYGPKI